MSATEADLRSLALAYAQGADRRDADRYVSAFHPDAVLNVHTPADHVNPDRVRRGHEELRRIPEMLGRYVATFHMIGQSTYDIGETRATGEVYCMARHLRDNGDGTATDHVMFIRYQDVYTPNADGEWKIATRAVVVDWTEAQAADLPGA